LGHVIGKHRPDGQRAGVRGAGTITSGVDVTEEAKQVALYRYELTGELYDDEEIRRFYEDDIVNLDVEDREAITF
jgi:hypothetical protein